MPCCWICYELVLLILDLFSDFTTAVESFHHSLSLSDLSISKYVATQIKRLPCEVLFTISYSCSLEFIFGKNGNSPFWYFWLHYFRDTICHWDHPVAKLIHATSCNIIFVYLRYNTHAYTEPWSFFLLKSETFIYTIGLIQIWLNPMTLIKVTTLIKKNKNTWEGLCLYIYICMYI